jgi:ATP-dependent Clp protease ATP-binding subunit ClpC
VEDPLSEELLKGTFDGKNTIVVDVVRDSDGKVARLDFQGEHRESDTPPQVAESSAS